MKQLFIMVVFVFITCLCNAQSKTVYGFVIDSITREPVSAVKIENLNSKFIARTNRFGQFGINVSVGNKILVAAPGYEQYEFIYTQLLYELDTIRVIVKPATTTIKDVVVSAYSYTDYQRDSTERRNEFIQRNGQIKKLFDNNNSGVGLGISIDNLFSKREKRKKRAYKQFEYLEQQQYIRFRYNPELVQSFTSLKGAELQNFIQKTQPSYKWLRTHQTREDIFYYINAQMKKHYP